MFQHLFAECSFKKAAFGALCAGQALYQDDQTQDIYAEMPLNSSRCAVEREREPTRSQRASSFAM
jgi:hypothetical protein